MCGIVGWVNAPPNRGALLAMLDAVRHRGPDGVGVHEGPMASLAHARQALVDLEGGRQPLENETGTIWTVCNGEIYNHRTLRERLQKAGHSFRSQSDSEVLIHLYEERGSDGFSELNGEYAFVIWDRNKRQAVLCRDRFGARPLYFWLAGATLYFASELKAILGLPSCSPHLDLSMLGALWTSWGIPPGRTLFREIHQVLPGHAAIWKPSAAMPASRAYWRMQFDEKRVPFQSALEQFADTLEDAVKLRGNADVPIAAYLSGGVDSSTVAALARKHNPQLHTFSLTFDSAHYDEGQYQDVVARQLGTHHHRVNCDAAALAAALPAMVSYTEAPQLRTGPISMSMLAAAVSQAGFKAVLTGEGADELLLGYDLFKETAVRRFMARNSKSAMRRQLIRRLYTYLPEREAMQPGLVLGFQYGLEAADDPYFSHRVRWHKTSRLHRYFREDVRAEFRPVPELLGERFAGDLAPLDWMQRAQLIEIHTFLEPYLLGWQGDRPAMSHAIEVRLPFLDHRVVELVNSLPRSYKLRSLERDKYILRGFARSLLPAEVADRPKVPYRAPVAEALKAAAGTWLQDVLSDADILAAGLFAVRPVRELAAKLRRDDALSEMDEMALCGIVTTQLWHRMFTKRPVAPRLSASA